MLADGVVSTLAFAFVSRDFDEWLLLQDHKPDSEHPYNDDSDLEHIASLHSEAQGIFGLCIRQYASTTVSCPHSVVSQGTFHRRVDTWQHVSRATNVAVDGAVPAVDLILGDCFPSLPAHFV